jgi:hypothetical protein
MTGTPNGQVKTIAAALETFGGDFVRWPDRDLAKRTMEQALSDRHVRAGLDAARSLDRGLAALRNDLDDEIARSGAAARILQATLAATAPSPFGRWRWAAAIAVLVTAAGLGSVADIGLANSDSPMQVVLVDPLVFGPMSGDDL